MSRTETGIESPSPVETEESAPAESSITDDKLAALFEEPGDETTETRAEEKSETPEAPEDGLDEAELEKWSQDETPESKQPAPDYVNDLVRVLPNRETAAYAIDAFQKQTAFDNAIQAGDIAKAIEAMPSMKTLVEAAVSAHIRDNEDAIVQTWIDKNDPDKQSPRVRALEERLQQLETDRTSRQSTEQQAAQQAQMQARFRAIDDAIPALLDSIRFSNEQDDRDTVSDFFRVELSKDASAMRRVREGDVKKIQDAVKPAMHRALKRFQKFDQRARPSKAKPKSPVPGGGITSGEGEKDRWQKATEWLENAQAEG